jgi:hemerythrin-like metal-binding protein
MALYKYTLFHFSEEEILMKQAGYKFREKHMREHAEFVRKLDALAGSVKASNDSIGMETFTWLVGWLLDHISVTDQKLADCLLHGEEVQFIHD